LKETWACLEENDAITNDPWVPHNHECKKSNDVDHEKKFGAENVQNYDETNSSQYVENTRDGNNKEGENNHESFQFASGVKSKRAYNKKKYNKGSRGTWSRVGSVNPTR